MFNILELLLGRRFQRSVTSETKRRDEEREFVRRYAQKNRYPAIKTIRAETLITPDTSSDDGVRMPSQKRTKRASIRRGMVRRP